MGLERLVKKLAGIFLTGSLAFSGCFMPKVAETIRLERNFVVPKDYGKEPIRITKANNILFDFPDADEIPGARKVDKYLTPGAEYFLVHIRQSHFKKDMTEEKKQQVIEVQQNIYKILSYFVENLNLKEVYVEGVTSDIEELEERIAQESVSIENMSKAMTETLEDYISSLERRLNDEPLISVLYPEEKDAEQHRDSLRKQIEIKKAQFANERKRYEQYENLKKQQILYGAAFVLSEQGKIKILAAEDSKIQERAEYRGEKLKRGEKLTFDEILDITDNREDFVLRRISERESGQKNQMMVVIYGGLHAFGGEYSFGKNYNSKGRVNIIDNIAKWNFLHPENTISLIDITPEAYPKED